MGTVHKIQITTGISSTTAVVTSPPISVKLRDPSECIEEFFNKHIEHYKIINKKYYEGQLIERGNSCSILDISKHYTLQQQTSNNQETQTSNLQISLDDMTLNANIVHGTDKSIDGETSATETTANTNTNDTITEVHTNDSYIIVTEDINFDNLTNNRERASLNGLLASHDLRRLALPPTRVTSTSNSSIDIFCTNLPPADLPKILDNSTSSTYRDTSSRNLNNLKHLLATETWENVTQSNDADDSYDNFLITFTRTLDVACPFKTKKQHQFKRNTYDNEEALSLRKEFIKAQDKFNLTRME
ncbi:hypothetical protein J6590_066959 [Homalodisca vitripennis]|nr:hypothetical protein J6590_066959 [Homalodisca vitripennis]